MTIRTLAPPLIGRNAEARHTWAGVGGVVDFLLDCKLLDERRCPVAGRGRTVADEIVFQWPVGAVWETKGDGLGCQSVCSQSGYACNACP